MNHIIGIRLKLLLLLATNSILGYAQIEINVNVEADDNSTQHIYLAANINNWNPADADFKLQPTEASIYQITFTPPHGVIEFKFTKGS